MQNITIIKIHYHYFLNFFDIHLHLKQSIHSALDPHLHSIDLEVYKVATIIDY